MIVRRVKTVRLRKRDRAARRKLYREMYIGRKTREEIRQISRI